LRPWPPYDHVRATEELFLDLLVSQEERGVTADLRGSVGNHSSIGQVNGHHAESPSFGLKFPKFSGNEDLNLRHQAL
jgi:hypothetical protein